MTGILGEPELIGILMPLSFARHTLPLARLVIRRFLADNCRQAAMVLTYTTLFAVVPVMTVVFDTVCHSIPSACEWGYPEFCFSELHPQHGCSRSRALAGFFPAGERIDHYRYCDALCYGAHAAGDH